MSEMCKIPKHVLGKVIGYMRTTKPPCTLIEAVEILAAVERAYAGTSAKAAPATTKARKQRKR